MENQEIPWRIQMERLIPVEIFRGITFFPFLPKRPKFSVPFVWITSARLHVERERKIYRHFVNGITQSQSCFRYQKKYQFHLKENVYRNFNTNGKRSKGTSLASLVPIVEKWSLNALESSWFCISIVVSFNWGHFNSWEKLKTMLMQNFGVTSKEHYGMLWYFLEWSIGSELCSFR